MRHFLPPNSKDTTSYKKLYLSGFDINLFISKQKKLANINCENMEDAALREAIQEVMTFYNNITGQSYYFIPTWQYRYTKGKLFYRVRKIDKNDTTIPLESIKNWNDAWNPPENQVLNFGRLNYPYESLLYTASDFPEIAIKEMKIEDQDRFALITYEAVEDIYVTIVGFFQDDPSLTPEENEKCQVLTKYFFDNFTKEVNAGNEHLYKMSANIIKECYTIPDDTQDGWVYPSIASQKGHNVCFKPEITNKKLQLKGIEICRLDERHGFVVNYVLGELQKNSNFTYHLIGSGLQKTLYPHISLCE